ncbi:MAG: fused response regulator/phosphatase [Gammaproteobacteria bacterium]|nr:MAG: fused response regulator/phosphatase [Gammaproteobacteria bacterium]
MSDSEGVILVIDDDAEHLEAMAFCLRKKAYQVLCANNLADGLALFRSQKPELIICASNAPLLDGVQLLRTVVNESVSTPVILSSHSAERDDLMKALRLGALDYFIKPIDDYEMVEHAVRRGVERARLMHENQHYRLELEAANKTLTERLRLMKEDQEAGRFIQFKMLPKSPLEILGCRVESKIIPSLYLSGDFVDCFQLNERYMVFYLADVSGHGSSSAFVTILLKMLITDLRRDFSRQNDHTLMHPAQVLQRINEQLLQLELGKHLTMYYGVLDVEADTLTYSAAAHYPPPILCTDGYSTVIESTALPVGIFKDAQYNEVSVSISKKFSLVMFTDGIMEVLPQESLVEKEQFLLNLVNNGDKSFQRINAELKLDQIVGAPDDIGLLVVSRAG